MLTPEGLQRRSRLLRAIRSFFYERAYIEVDTPQRLPVLIPESNIIPFASEDCFLQTSPELCMKRLLGLGCERIFQICHCFRKEEQGRLHQSEFTMLEWYQKGADYRVLMTQCEELLRFVAGNLADLPGVDGADQGIRHREWFIDLASPWERITVAEAFRRYTGVDPQKALREDRFDELLVTAVEPQLGQKRPTFLYDYPVELGSLARRSPLQPEVAERFELYVAGVELANGFSELADASEQRQRFAAELKILPSGGGAMPEKLLAALPAMGEAAGIALGVDRLLMLLMGCTTLSAALPFLFEEL